ncbi:MAG: DUF2892 domain-containing protein [Lachnospiraceae bacterium]|nr:DUF2892 domain-containing protein [Lachnospiraceae bacterium]
MKKNIGKIDSFIRIAIGLTVLGCGTARKCCCSIIIGAMTAASGITSFCPFLYMAELKTKMLRDK